MVMNISCKFEKASYNIFLVRAVTLSGGYNETEANLCFAIFGKNSKNQNGRHFFFFWGGGNFFLKIAMSTLLKYPVGRKFRRNRSIWYV